MNNEYKNKAQSKQNLILNLPEVPSISNMDTFSMEKTTELFPFAEMTGTEPEAVLDIPTFSGLDMLDMETAAQTIEDLEEENTRKETMPEIPSFSDEIQFDRQDTGLPVFFDEAGEQTDLPAIPSFSDEEDRENAEAETENLPEISSFFLFSHEKKKDSVIIEVPERPDEEFKGDLTEAAKDMLPQIPSVLDLNELDMLSMPGSIYADTPVQDEEEDYLPDIPSVMDWEEKDEEIPEMDEDICEETVESVSEEMLAEEEIVHVDEMPLSVKAKNGLLRIHIRDSRQLLQTETDRLENIPHIDEKTLYEIQKYKKAKENAVYPSVRPVSREIRNYLEEFLEELAELNIPPQKQRVLKVYLCAALPETGRTKEKCYAAWYREEHVCQLMDSYIIGLIRNRQMSGLSETMLRENIPASMDTRILSEMLQEMIRSDRIYKTRGEYYILKYPSVLEFLSENTEEKEQHIDVIRQRMNGRLLGDIAKQNGMSRELVSRIQNKLLRLVQKLCLINSTSVYEERFRPLFERYNLSKELFTALTKESAEVYQYLSMVSVAGSARPEEMKYDFGVPDWIRLAWKNCQEEKNLDSKVKI